MKRRIYLIVVVGFGAAVWLGGPLLLQAGGDAAKGRPLYEKYCLLCHGPQGRGDGPEGQLMKPPATNFRSPASKAKPDDVLLKAIREGHPKTAMTDWKRELSEEDIINVLAYVRGLSGGPEKGL
jgi:mono/diheme cytochrome c family protein